MQSLYRSVVDWNMLVCWLRKFLQRKYLEKLNTLNVTFLQVCMQVFAMAVILVGFPPQAGSGDVRFPSGEETIKKDFER